MAEMSRPAPPPAQPLKAALWMTGAITSFSAMAVAGREIAGVHDTFETMLYRSLTGIVIVITVALVMGRLGEVSLRKFHVHALRNVFHFTGQNLWFYAVAVIPLAQVFALEFTSPLWVTVFAPLVLGERLTRTRALAAGLGFVGILIVARPGVGEINAGVAAAGASALFFAGTILLTKFLTRTETITCILFWLTVQQAVLGVIFAGWDGVITLPTAATLPYVLVIGCAGLLAHLCVTNALRIAPATVVIPFDFLRLPLIALVGMAVYGEALDIFVFLGGAIILGANILNLRAEGRSATVS